MRNKEDNNTEVAMPRELPPRLKKANDKLNAMSALSLQDHANFIAAGNWGENICIIMRLHNKSLQVVLNNTTGTTITVGSSIITINPSGAIGITGNVTITGNLIVTGSVTSATNITGGIPMLAHTHAYTDNGVPAFTGIPV